MKKARGFTLLELMIVVVVIAILAAIAIPMFTSQLRKSRRADAARALSEVQLRQERWRASHANYIGTDSSAGDKTSFGNLPTSEWYDFAFDSVASGTTFRVKATAKAGTAQASDSACSPMKIEVTGNNVSKTPTGNRCWD